MSTAQKHLMKRAAAFFTAIALCVGVLNLPGVGTLQVHAAEEPFITGYSVLDANGNELSTITPGTVFTLAISISHPDVPNTITEDNIRIRIHPGAFTMKDLNDVKIRILQNSSGTTPLTYTATFPNMTYVGGTATVSIDVSYIDTQHSGGAGINIPLKTLSLTIGQAVDNSTVPDIAIRNTSYGGSSVAAGSNFTLSVGATNTSTNITAENVTVSITLPESLTLNGGSSMVTVGNVGPGGNIASNFSLSAKPGAATGPASITLTYSFYATVQGQMATTPYTVSRTISVPIQQPDRFTLGTHDISQTIFLGDEGVVTINFTNKGKTSLYNVSGEIRGENLANPSTEYLGVLAAGAENSLDFYVQAQEIGTMTGEVVITYEDEGGEVHTVKVPFSIAVEEGYDIGPIGPIEPMPTPDEKGSSIWLYVVIALLLLAAGGGFFFYKKKKKAKEDEDDLDDDFDDDFGTAPATNVTKNAAATGEEATPLENNADDFSADVAQQINEEDIIGADDVPPMPTDAAQGTEKPASEFWSAPDVNTNGGAHENS
ncbi:LPXTG cell wall anchor domain-containing protein [Ruminococcaceae bacterium OttesenSCG-928-N02]|nr:LPXTG cell wall anchor domain-containing protein [Ruminococcaceae bacterium OttesenSCG-928-N02]